MNLLKELRGNAAPGESDLVSELIDMFLFDAPMLLKRAQTALAAGDLQAVGRAAHALKGNSASLGAVPLTAACNAVETETRAGRTPSLENLASELERAVAAARALTQEGGG